MVEITNASNLMPASITVVEDGSTIDITTTPTDVTINSGVITIQTGGITNVNGDAGPVVVLDTGDIAENGNLYYTDARARASISATGDINYDSNTGVISYTTPATPVTSVNTQTGDVVLTTSDIAEGTNEYYTDARVQTKLGSVSGNILPDTNIAYDLGSNTARWRDLYLSGSSIVLGNLTLTESGGELSVTGGFDLSTNNTGDLSEGTNLYYTDGRVQTVIDANTAGFITNSALSPYYTSAQVDALPVSTFTNDAGYLTSETDSQTLSFVSPNLTISNGNTVDLSALTPTTIDWSTVTNTPTTISGYGITDAFDGAFGSLTGTPTTLAGYGITDGYTDADVDTHLNTSTATTGEVLSWTGTDYDWITPASGNPFNQNLNTTDDVTFNTVTATDEFVGNLDGAIRFSGKNVSGGTIEPGQVIYISGISGNTPEVDLARSDAASTMPAFGIAIQSINNNATGQFATFGSEKGLDIADWGETGVTFSQGDVLYVSATQAGHLTNVPPTGETNLIQNIGKVERAAPTTNTTIKVGGAGRTNATPNLNDGNIFIGNATNQSSTASLDTSVGAAGYIKNVVEDLSPQLGADLDVDDRTILNNGTNRYLVIGDGTPGRTDRAIGPWLTSNYSYDGSGRIRPIGSSSSITLTTDIPSSNGNGRIRNNYIETNLDMNSFNLQTAGNGRGMVSNQITPEITNTGDTAVELANYTGISMFAPYVTGNNVSIVDSKQIVVNNGVEVGSGSPGTNTNSTGIEINTIGGAMTLTGSLRSIHSTDSNALLDHAGPVKIGAYTLPNTDGTSGQVLTTDGAGNITFTTVSGGGGSFSGDLAGNTLTDSTQALTTIVNKSANPQSSATGLAATTQMSAGVTIGQSDNISGTTMTFEIASDIPSGSENIHFDRDELIFDTRGFSFVGDTVNGARINVRHGNSDFAVNGQGNINNLLAFQIDAGDNHNGTNDNTIANITGQRIRVRDDFDRSALFDAVGLDLSLDTNLSDASNSFRSIRSQNVDARLEHWGEGRFGTAGNVRLAPGDSGTLRIINNLNQSSPMVQKNVNNNPSFTPIDKTVIDQNISDQVYVVNETERGYYSTHGTRSTAITKYQAPTASSIDTPQVGFAQEITRPVYNTNTATTSTTNETLFNFNSFGTGGFWLFNSNVNVPARQNIAYGFNVNLQKGFDNPFVGANGLQAVFNLTTSAQHMTNRIVYSYNESSVSQFNAIPDSVWQATEMGVLRTNYDNLWSFGTAWEIECIAGISSSAANATVVIDKALPPAGLIRSDPGNNYQISPTFANTPTWANAGTKAITLTRPANGKQYYKWTIEWLDQKLFVKTWETWNLT